jgi:hypothetical protein
MRDLNVLALVKGAERFVFVYDDDSRDVSTSRPAIRPWSRCRARERRHTGRSAP